MAVESAALNSPCCVQTLDDTGAVRSFNEEGLRLMAIDSPTDIVGRYWPDLWPKNVRPTLITALEKTRCNGTANFQIRCSMTTGANRWWDVTIASLPGNIAQFIVILRDITAAHSDLAAEKRTNDRLQDIMRSNADILWDIDLVDNKVWWGEGMTSTLGYDPDQIGESTRWRDERIHPDDRKRIVEGMRAAIEDGLANWEGEFRYLDAAGRYRDVLDRGAILTDVNGKAFRFVGVMQDVTARTALGEAYKLVAGELAHRVNNVLAVVSGLFQNSVRSTTSRADLIDAFGGRVMAMAAANTAVLRSEFGGAKLEDLICVQLAPFIGAGRLRLSGPPVVLKEAMTQPFALAVNELATNALKYGALSNEVGRVDLMWRLELRGEQKRLIVDWKESGGPIVKSPTRLGLGSKLIERGIRNCEVLRRFHLSGFHCTLDLELD